MKQKKTVDAGSKKAAKPSIRKVGTMLGSGALCVLTIGTISICGLVNADRSTGSETKAAEVTTTTTETERAEDTYISVDTVTWRKASINEYEINEVKTSAETTTTASKASETTKKTTTSEEVTEKKIDKVKMYAKDIVNLRAEPDKNAEILAILDLDDEVTASAKTSNGWYAVSYAGYSGYVMDDYLTKTVPESAKTTTAASTTTSAATTTTKTKTTTSAKTTTASSAQSTTVSKSKTAVSCSDKEFEMLCCVLQGEVGDCSEASKIAVANVIINRVKSPKFENSIEGVLTSAGQFDAIYGYYNGTKKPSQHTIDCAKKALEGEDNTNGAVYYYAPRYCGASSAAWFESLTFCTEIEGQRFFKS